MKLDEARMAASPEGLALLAVLPKFGAAHALAVGADLRARGFAPALVAAAMTQARLRERAAQRFGEFAAGMLFTPEGLEQATRLAVAGHHARRFRNAGARTVADLTCGIGADAMALSALGIAVVAFEIDEATATLADYNLRHWEASVVVHANGMQTVPDTAVDAVFADPSRRLLGGSAHARRLNRPEDYEPPLPAILDLRDQFPALGIKVGPGIHHSALPRDAETQWVSVDGEVVEAGIWCGPLASHAGRGALVIVGEAAHPLLASGVHATTGPMGDFLYEPDGACIRAGLVGEVAKLLGARLLDSSIAYVTADSWRPTPFAHAYRILDNLPFGVKALRAYLRERGVGRVTIKKRGTAVTPEVLRPQLDLRGDGEATIILTRVAGAQRALVVEPIREVG